MPLMLGGGAEGDGCGGSVDAATPFRLPKLDVFGDTKGRAAKKRAEPTSEDEEDPREEAQVISVENMQQKKRCFYLRHLLLALSYDRRCTNRAHEARGFCTVIDALGDCRVRAETAKGYLCYFVFRAPRRAPAAQAIEQRRGNAINPQSTTLLS